MSQEKLKPELIDLTNESKVQDITITIEDSFVEDDNVEDDDQGEMLVTQYDESKRVKITKAAAKQLRKELRDRAKELKQQQQEQQKIQKEANKANAACRSTQNCFVSIDSKLSEILVDQKGQKHNFLDTIGVLFSESLIDNFVTTSSQKIDYSVSWTYKYTQVVDGKCVPSFRDLNWTLVVMKGEDYAKQLLTYQENPISSNSIKSTLYEIAHRTKTNVILLVFGLAEYLAVEKKKENRLFSEAFRETYSSSGAQKRPNEESVISKILTTTQLQDNRLALEMELQRDHSNFKFHIEFHEKVIDACTSIVRFTSSLAKREAKRVYQTSASLDWAINMDKERATDPTRSSEHLTKLWITQLQQFSQVTLPIAKAIANDYPYPGALVDQYQCLSSDEAEGLLAGLYVQKNLKRQIGPNISRRIHRFMTCEDPDAHIGLE